MYVVVTGIEGDMDKLDAPLRDVGFKTKILPTLQIVSLPLSEASVSIIKSLETYDYIFFTSAHAVDYFFTALKIYISAIPEKFPKIFAIGSVTAEACVIRGFEAAVVSNFLPSTEGKRILLPRSAIASMDTVQELQQQGAFVTIIPLYTVIPVTVDQSLFTELFEGGTLAIVCLSPSSVRSFSNMRAGSMLKEKIDALPLICIGPTTARSAREEGFTNVAVADIFTADGIVRALNQAYSL